MFGIIIGRQQKTEFLFLYVGLLQVSGGRTEVILKISTFLCGVRLYLKIAL
jgi:hypothetical protein